MKQKLFLSTLLFFVFSVGTIFAQGKGEGKKMDFEKFKAEREAFIVEELKLSEDEAKAFLPLADELMMKKFELNEPLREEHRKIREARKDGKTISEADYKKAVELNAEIRLKEAQLEKEYIAKFLKVISAEKVYQYHRAEQEFGRKAMERRRGLRPPHRERE